MASFRALQPMVRQAPRLVSRPVGKRFLNTDTAPILYSAHAKVVGARAEGHIESDTLTLDLGMPKELGGTGDKTNPEELFAAGYGACFQSALTLTGKTMGIHIPSGKDDNVVDVTTHLVGDVKALDMGIRVNMKIKVRGVKKEDLEKVAEKTKETCPYSRSIKGNVTTNIEVEEMK